MSLSAGVCSAVDNGALMRRASVVGDRSTYVAYVSTGADIVILPQQVTGLCILLS